MTDLEADAIVDELPPGDTMTMTISGSTLGGALDLPMQMPAPAIVSAEDRELEMMNQALLNPAIDVAKMSAIYDLLERRRKDKAQIAFARAFSAMQMNLPTISRDGKITITNKEDKDKPVEERRIIQSTSFATLANILETIRPILRQHGFSVSFEPGNTPGPESRPQVTCIVMHDDGHFRTATQSGPLDTSGSKNNLQASGSTNAYLSRYLVVGMLAIVSRDPRDGDDDGKGADPQPEDTSFITDAQIAKIETEIRDTKSDREKFLEKIGSPSVPEMTKSQYERAIALFAQKKKLGAK